MVKPKLKGIMLVDDDFADNIYHSRVIKKSGCTEEIIVMNNPVEALEYLQQGDIIKPDLIFLDLNMPQMSGWDFLEEYKKLPGSHKANAIVVMLTTSLNPDDVSKAEEIGEVAKYLSKPLKKEMLLEILQGKFPDRFEE